MKKILLVSVVMLIIMSVYIGWLLFNGKIYNWKDFYNSCELTLEQQVACHRGCMFLENTTGSYTDCSKYCQNYYYVKWDDNGNCVKCILDCTHSECDPITINFECCEWRCD